MSLHQAMRDACAAVGIDAPKFDPRPGQWLRTDDLDKRRGNKNGSVTINDDMRSGCAWNHTTGQHQRFWIGGASTPAPARKRTPWRHWTGYSGKGDEGEQDGSSKTAGEEKGQQGRHAQFVQGAAPQEAGA